MKKIMYICKKRLLNTAMIIALCFFLPLTVYAEDDGLFADEGWRELESTLYGNASGKDDILYIELDELEEKLMSLVFSVDASDGLSQAEQAIIHLKISEYADIVQIGLGIDMGGDVGTDEIVKPDAVEESFSKPWANGAINLWHWISSWNIDISIDGLVYGRMSENYNGKADFTHFGLEANNPYGVTGSTFFYPLQRIVFALIPIIFMGMLIMQIFNHDDKNRIKLKMFFQDGLLIMLLLFAVPYFWNFFIYFRDAVFFVMSKMVNGIMVTLGITEGSFGSSVILTCFSAYLKSPSMMNAFLLLAAVLSGVFLLGNYVVNAAVLTVCFGLFPLIAFLSLWKKQMLNAWMDLVIPIYFVSFIDVILILIPTFMHAIYKMVFGSNAGIVMAIILLIIMWSMVPIRSLILKKIFNFEGIVGRGAGLGAIAFMAMRAMSQGMFQGKGGNVHVNGGHAGGSAKEMMQLESKRALAMEKADLEVPKLSNELPLSYDSELGTKTNELLSVMNEANSDGISAVGGADDRLPGVEGMLEADSSMAMNVPTDIESLDKVMPTGNEMVGIDSALSNEEAILSDLSPMNDPDFLSKVDDVTALDFSNMPSNLKGLEMPSKEAFMDADFTRTLSGGDLGRYENLAQMDALNDKISSNEAIMRSAGYNRATYRADKQGHYEHIEQLNSSIAQTKESMGRITDKSSVEYQKYDALLQSAQSSLQSHRVQLSQLDNAAKLDNQNAAYRQKVQDCNSIETQYAQNRAVGGMSDRRYSSASAYKQQMEFNAMKKELVNYQNFDSRAYEGVLTPQERESFYRERDIKMKERAIARVAVGAAVAVPAAFATAYGGSMASISTGAVAYSLGAGMVPDFAVNRFAKNESAQKVTVSNSTVKNNGSGSELDNWNRTMSRNASSLENAFNSRSSVLEEKSIELSTSSRNHEDRWK